jgi:glycosyltransferase involved in cell wall biosynthesis
MRICMLLRNPFTRDARVLREARTLARAGHTVTVIAVRAAGLRAREERDGFTIIRAVPGRPLAGPTIAGAGGSRMRSLPRPSLAVLARDLLFARAFHRAAMATPADVYHAHDLNTLEPAARAARATGARLVYDAHELYPDLTGLTTRESARWKRLEQRLIGRADAVVVPSPARAEEMHRRYGVTPAVVMNCPEGAPIEGPAGDRLAGFRRPGEALLVYAGGFTPNRGLENLIAAAGTMRNARLVMIGWGPLEPVLRERAAGFDRVAFGDAVDPDELVGVLAGADIGLAPYLPVGLNNILAAPNKLFEYLHAGLAVAASDLPDIRNVVTTHGVGTLFDAAEPASIASAVEELAGSADRLAQAKANARAAAPLYTWDAQARVLLEIYDRLTR